MTKLYCADDATVHTHGNTQNEIASKLQQDGNNTKLSCKQNKMEIIQINYDKTTCTYMIVGTQHRTKQILPMNICIDGNNINRNYLDHIDHLFANISSQISLLRQLSIYIPTKAQTCSVRGIFYH